MAARKDGRWGNTQENAHVLEALVAYYRKHETVVPDFRAVVALGGERAGQGEFHAGDRRRPLHVTCRWRELLAKAAPGDTRPLTFRREGAGTLFYATRLRYAADRMFQEGLDQGIHIERSYAPLAETGTRPESTRYRAGDLVRITLQFQLPKERRYVAVTDPLPAGFEAVESWFATTAASLATQQDDQGVTRR